MEDAAAKYGVHVTTLHYWDKKLRQDLSKPKANGKLVKSFRYCPHCGESLK